MKEILERWAKALKNHGIVLAFRSEPTYRGDAGTTCEDLVYVKLMPELGVLRTGGFKLYSDVLPRNNVGCKIDNTYNELQ
jgi:hypothetical protein